MAHHLGKYEETMSNKLEIYQFPCLSDNYGVLVHDPASGDTAAIDAPEAAAVFEALKATGWHLTHLLNTHHHGDHTAGNLDVKTDTGCVIVGPRAEAGKIPGIDVQVGDGDVYEFGGETIRVFDTPGHTAGHITYFLPENKIAFVGDTIFALGCGRVIEGTMAMMWASLKKLIDALPADTMIYCGHEYTQANAKFALSVDPDNTALKARSREIDDLRAKGKPTVPSNFGLELETNPFLRADDAGLQAVIGMAGGDPASVFAEIRTRKDNF
jgi:hydroxyacylglutathione hydrolase